MKIVISIFIVAALLLYALIKRSKREIKEGIPTPNKEDFPKVDEKDVVEEPKEMQPADEIGKPTASKARKPKRSPKSAKD